MHNNESEHKMKEQRMNKTTLSNLMGDTPPSAIDSERCILGSILIDPSIFSDIFWSYFVPDAFFCPSHRAIFCEMVILSKREGTLDLVVLQKELESKGILEAIGGVDKLIDLAQANPSGSQVKEHAMRLMDSYARRQAIGFAGDLLSASMSEELDITTTLEKIMAKIDKLIYDDCDFTTFLNICQRRKK